MSISQKAIDAVAAMRAIDLRNATEAEVQVVLKIVSGLPISIMPFPKDHSIARTRCVRDFMGSNVYREKDISYNPHVKSIGVGRANMAEQPVFYGVSMVDTYGTSQSRAVSYAETSTIVLEDSLKEAEEFVITGRWRVLEPFNVLWFIHHQDFKNPDPHLDDFREAYKKSISDRQDVEDSIYINEAIASEFAKEVLPENGYEYGITSAIGKFLLEECGCDAIGFPSVKSGGNGMNLAIHPRVLDAGKMKLEVVIVEKAYKFGKNVFNYPYLVCDKFRPDGSFIYESQQDTTKEGVYEILKSQGLL